VFFVNASIFLKVIEKFLFKKIQRHEKRKTLIELQLNSIRNMVSKALSDDEISTSEFEKITSQMTKKYRSLKKWIWKLIRCCQRNWKVLFRINEHPS